MKLILSGGGSGEKTKELDELFASLLNKSQPLLYIPIAIDPQKHSYPECLEWIKKTFDELGIELYEMWTEKDLLKSKSTKPNKFGGIYIGGGNTPYLLKTLKESGFLDFLKRAIKLDIPIYGGSAGAIIFAKSIIPSLYHDENNVNLKDFKAMNILNNNEITCHYEKSEDKQIKDMMNKHKLNKVIALSEKTGIYIKDNKARIVGKEPAFLFSGKEKFKISVGKRILFVF